MSRRERWAIFGAILYALDEERARTPHVRLSNVAARANVAYNRLGEHLQALAEAGLVDNLQSPSITARGRRFLEEYSTWSRTMQDYSDTVQASRLVTPSSS
ncbi:MAG TPA: winged helix-turn-helix domain-containing protein [Candidatus Thermoplasmatota archaeon]|nr:winged helix-turn-helix domain-containing protein [Candidatus Thermoplasmatota archaeon]